MTVDKGDLVLALNSGSSSLKYAAFDLSALKSGSIFTGQVGPGAIGEAFDAVELGLTTAGVPAPAAIGHRIVHGGPGLLQHCLVDASVLRELEQAEAFAPLHVPAALELLRLATSRYPDAMQVACFDTAFHADLPDLARTLPIPRALRKAGVHRYGFHGLSCASIVGQLGDALPPRVIIAHLGHGASVTAIRDGRSIDTSMGLTPSGGAIMGTRCGDIDPGVLVHLMRTEGYGASELEEMVGRRSGMLGVSDLSGDMRVLRSGVPGSPSDLAVRMFCRSVSKQVAAMMAALGGADLLVFSGGIGEHDEETRGAICADLAWAGVALDPHHLPAAAGCKVLTLPAREEEQIARHVGAVLDRCEPR